MNKRVRFGITPGSEADIELLSRLDQADGMSDGAISRKAYRKMREMDDSGDWFLLVVSIMNFFEMLGIVYCI